MTDFNRLETHRVMVFDSTPKGQYIRDIAKLSQDAGLRAYCFDDEAAALDELCRSTDSVITALQGPQAQDGDFTGKRLLERVDELRIPRVILGKKGLGREWARPGIDSYLPLGSHRPTVQRINSWLFVRSVQLS